MSTSSTREARSAAEPAPTAPPEKASYPVLESLLAAPEVKQTYGVVEGTEGRHILVRAGADLVRAARAKSCLLEPARGDTVLVSRSEHHGSFVLAVLDSPEENSGCTVDIEGDLTLRSKTGKVAITAGETVSVVAGKNLAINTPEIAANTAKATLFADSLSYVGRTIDAQVERVRHIGQKLESVIDIVTERVKYSSRTIEKIEKVQANELHVRAESTLNVHGKNTVMTAEKLVKLDGEQIHLG